MKKKAQISSLQGIILTLVVIGIILGIGFVVLTELKENVPAYESRTGNETTSAAVKEAGVYLSKNNSCNFLITSVVVSNRTNEELIIGSLNYSYVAATGRIYYALTSANGQVNNTIWNVSYVYNYGGGSCEGIASTVSAVKKIPVWLPIVVILLLVGIILAIVFGLLSKGAGGGISFGRSAGGTVAEI